MLRDILCFFNGVETWPCDEINYIWRYGNASFPTDGFSRDMATKKVKRYIRKQFAAQSIKVNASIIVEKTCASTLRVDFIDEVFPDAKFIHIIRDGRDVAVSANDRWHAKLDIPYLLSKARFVPLTDLPYYASKYLINRVSKLLGVKKRLSTWGPRFSGMDKIFRTKPPCVACVLQWKYCVESAVTALEKINPKRVFTLTYEDFVLNPVPRIQAICNFIGIDEDHKLLRESVSSVRCNSVGRWKTMMEEEEAEMVHREISNLLLKLGYSIN